jgi:hypothetical protein
MTIEHENLGTCKVHLEVTLNNGKCFKFVEAMKFPQEVNVSKYGWSTKTVWTHIGRDRRMKNPHYYALWGNTPDDWRMGCTKLTTDKGSNVRSIRSATKKFLELVNASEKMTFSK